MKQHSPFNFFSTYFLFAANKKAKNWMETGVTGMTDAGDRLQIELCLSNRGVWLPYYTVDSHSITKPHYKR